MSQVMYALARARPGLKIQEQLDAIKAFAGNADLRLFEIRKGSDDTLEHLLKAIRPTNILIVYRLVALVPPKAELERTAPRTFLDKVLNELVAKQVQIIEVQTGMDLNKASDAQLAVSRAYNDLSGYKRQKAGPGRNPNPPLAETERLRLQGIWESGKYRTNAEAVAAMGGKWTVMKAIKMFGPSGRNPGRPKQTK